MNHWLNLGSILQTEKGYIVKLESLYISSDLSSVEFHYVTFFPSVKSNLNLISGSFNVIIIQNEKRFRFGSLERDWENFLLGFLQFKNI